MAPLLSLSLSLLTVYRKWAMRVTGDSIQSRVGVLLHTVGILEGLRDPNLLGSSPTYLLALRHAKLGTVDLHLAATHPEQFIRGALCHNPACPPATRQALLQDPVWIVRDSAWSTLREYPDVDVSPLRPLTGFVP